MWKQKFLSVEKQLRFNLDTGASTNVMSRNICEEASGDTKLKKPTITKSKLVMFNRSTLLRDHSVSDVPRVSSDLESFIEECQTCQEFSQNQQKEPLISSEIPELPCQYVAADLFDSSSNLVFYAQSTTAVISGQCFVWTQRQKLLGHRIIIRISWKWVRSPLKITLRSSRKWKLTLQDKEYQRSWQPTMVPRSMHMTPRNLHKLMDLNMSPVLLVLSTV